MSRSWIKGPLLLTSIATVSVGLLLAAQTVAPTPSYGSPVVVASDAFSRVVNGGWGAADVGGPWKVASGAVDFAVDGSRGSIKVSKSVGARQAVLTQTSISDVDAAVTVSFSSLPTTGRTYGHLLMRRQSDGATYRVGLWINAKGKVGLLAQTNSGTKLFDVTTALPGTAGASYRLRVQVTGSNPTTLKAKTWPAATSEPATWAATATSSTTGLQGAGNIGVRSTTASSSTITTSLDNLDVIPAEGEPTTALGAWRAAAPTGFSSAGGLIRPSR